MEVKLKGIMKELIIETLKPIFFWFIQLGCCALFLSDKPKNGFALSSFNVISTGPTSVGMDFSLHGYDHVYGIPQHTETLLLKNTR